MQGIPVPSDDAVDIAQDRIDLGDDLLDDQIAEESQLTEVVFAQERDGGGHGHHGHHTEHAAAPSLDSYDSPQAPPAPAPVASNEQYGAPQAAPIDSYGAPQAPIATQYNPPPQPQQPIPVPLPLPSSSTSIGSIVDIEKCLYYYYCSGYRSQNR